MLTIQSNEALRLITSSAQSLDYIFEFVDGEVVQGNIAEANTREIAKGAREIKRFGMVNLGGSAQTVILKKSVTGNRTYQLTPEIDLATGEALYYEQVTGLRLMDAQGRIRFSTA